MEPPCWGDPAPSRRSEHRQLPLPVRVLVPFPRSSAPALRSSRCTVPSPATAPPPSEASPEVWTPRMRLGLLGRWSASLSFRMLAEVILPPGCCTAAGTPALPNCPCFERHLTLPCLALASLRECTPCSDDDTSISASSAPARLSSMSISPSSPTTASCTLCGEAIPGRAGGTTAIHCVRLCILARWHHVGTILNPSRLVICTEPRKP